MSGRGCRIYIGNLAKDCREKDVERKFEKYGRIRDVLVKYGYGFVEYDDSRDAEDAVHGMDGRDFLGERCQVEIARGTRRDRSRDRKRGSRAPWMDKYGPPQRTKYKVTVENLSTRVSWQDLKDVVRRAGEVCYADAHKGRKNEGVLEFATRRDMEKAIEKFDGHEMNGRAIKMVDCTKRSRSRDRRRSRSRSRSGRSRSGSKRSRSRSKSKRSRSRSKSKRSRSRSKEADSKKTKRSRSKSNRSRSKPKRSRSKSNRSRSKSNKSRSKSGERSRSRSGERAEENGVKDEKKSRSRSRSKSGDRADQAPDGDDKE